MKEKKRARSSGIAIVAGFFLGAGASPAQDHQGHHPAHAAAGATSPYAAVADRAISSLSDDDVRGLLAGHGVGMARPAELHHHPGPRHVLDLGAELALSEAQASALRDVYARMLAAVVPLGGRYVEQERRLDALFAGGKADEASLRATIDEAARLQADLRFAHLRAHLATRALLSPAQIARYDQLRGY